MLALLVTAVAGCAKQGYPSGGPKDETAPKAVAAKPANESRNFAGRQFSIAFDEYVTVKDADNNILISPPMRQKPEFTTKGKRLVEGEGTKNIRDDGEDSLTQKKYT